MTIFSTFISKHLLLKQSLQSTNPWRKEIQKWWKNQCIIKRQKRKLRFLWSFFTPFLLSIDPLFSSHSSNNKNLITCYCHSNINPLCTTCIQYEKFIEHLFFSITKRDFFFWGFSFTFLVVKRKSAELFDWWTFSSKVFCYFFCVAYILS